MEYKPAKSDGTLEMVLYKDKWIVPKGALLYTRHLLERELERIQHKQSTGSYPLWHKDFVLWAPERINYLKTITLLKEA